jgi:FAD:protein FMN transferase
LYRAPHNATEGAMSPLVGARLENLGYDRDYTLTPREEAIDVPIWDDIMHWDGTRLVTSAPVLVDVGAAGKGYLVDLVAVVLRDAGIDEYLIDASGDLLHRGATPVRVGLEHPFDPTQAIGVCELSNAALCASAPGRRSWGQGLHHILDATTGLPTNTVAATWALAATGLLADGLATALFFAAAPALGAGARFEYVRMFPDSRIEYSRSFPGELFTAEETNPDTGAGGSQG